MPLPKVTVGGYGKTNSLDRIISLSNELKDQPVGKEAKGNAVLRPATTPEFPVLPDGRIMTDAIVNARKRMIEDREDGKVADTKAELDLADGRAKALCLGGLDKFAKKLLDELWAANRSFNRNQRLGKTANEVLQNVRLVAARLLNSDAVAWYAEHIAGRAVATKDDSLINEIDSFVGRGITMEKLHEAGVALLRFVADGRMGVDDVAAFANESTFKSGDAISAFQAGARVIGTVRREMYEKGWGNVHRLIVKNMNRPDCKQLKALYENLGDLVRRVRDERVRYMQRHGLQDALPRVEWPRLKPGETTEAAVGRYLEDMGKQFTKFGKIVGKLPAEGAATFAETDAYLELVANFLEQNGRDLPQDVAAELEKQLGIARDAARPAHVGSFLREIAAPAAKEFANQAAIVERKALEEELRPKLAEALGQLPKKDGAPKPGSYNISLTVKVGFALGKILNIEAGVKVSLSMQISIGADGTADLIKGLTFGGYASASAEAASAVKVKAELSGDREISKSIHYSSVSDLLGDVSGLTVLLVTGKGAVSAIRGLKSKKLLDQAYITDNLALRNVLENCGVMDRSDKFQMAKLNAEIRDYDVTKGGSGNGGISVEAGFGPGKLTAGVSGTIEGSNTEYYTHTRLSDVVRKSPQGKVAEDLLAAYGSKLPKVGDKDAENLLAEKIRGLQKELRGFSAAALAAQHIHSGIAVSQLGRPEKTFEEYLEGRGISLSTREWFRAVFSRTRQSTLATKFLVDLARELAATEVRYRQVLAAKKKEMPGEMQHHLLQLDEQIYGNPGFRTVESGMEDTLFISSKYEMGAKTLSGTVDISFGAEMPDKIPGVRNIGVKPSGKFTFVRTFDETVNGELDVNRPPYGKPGLLTISCDFGSNIVLDDLADMIIKGMLAGKFGGAKEIGLKAGDRIVLKQSIMESLRPLQNKLKGIKESTAGKFDAGLEYEKSSGHTLKFSFAVTGDRDLHLTLSRVDVLRKEGAKVGFSGQIGAAKGSIELARNSSQQLYMQLVPNSLNAFVKMFELLGGKRIADGGVAPRWINAITAHSDEAVALLENVVKSGGAVGSELAAIERDLSKDEKHAKKLGRFRNALAEIRKKKAQIEGGTIKKATAVKLLTDLLVEATAIYDPLVVIRI